MNSLPEAHLSELRQDQTRRSLEWAYHYLQEHRAKPEALRRHAPSFLHLSKTVFGEAGSRDAGLDFILALHPWPVRWGLWDEWLGVLRLGASQYGSDGRRRALFLAHLAQMLADVGRLENACDTARMAVDLASQHGRAQALGVGGAALITALLALGQTQEAEQTSSYLELRLAETEGSAATLDVQEAALRLALPKTTLLRRLGQHHQGIALMNYWQAVLEKGSRPRIDLLAQVYEYRATLHWSLSHYQRAVDDLQQAIQYYSTIGDEIGEVLARGNLGLVFWSMADLSQAEANILNSIAQCERLKAGYELVRQVGNMTAVCFSSGELKRGQAYARRHLELARQTGDAEEAARALSNLSGLDMYLGDVEGAEPGVRQSLAEFERQQRAEAVIGAKVDLAFILSRTQRLQEGLEIASQALAEAERLHIASLKTIALRAMAECAPSEEREPLLRQALVLAEACARPLDKAGCLLSLARVAARPEERLRCWQAGVDVLERMGGQAWIENRSPEDPPFLALVV